MSWAKITTYEVLKSLIYLSIAAGDLEASMILYIDGNNNADLSIEIDVDRVVRFNPLEAQFS